MPGTQSQPSVPAASPATSAGPPPVWADLTRRFANGDGDALGQIFEALFDELVADLRRTTGRDEAFASDAVQDAFTKAIKGLPVMETQKQVKAWFERSATNAAIDRIRSENRRRARERRSAQPEQDEQHGSAASDESMRGLLERLSEIDDESAFLIDARVRFGWTLDRIGRAVGLRAGAVDGRIRRVLGGIRDTETSRDTETRR